MYSDVRLSCAIKLNQIGGMLKRLRSAWCMRYASIGSQLRSLENQRSMALGVGSQSQLTESKPATILAFYCYNSDPFPLFLVK